MGGEWEDGGVGGRRVCKSQMQVAALVATQDRVTCETGGGEPAARPSCRDTHQQEAGATCETAEARCGESRAGGGMEEQENASGEKGQAEGNRCQSSPSALCPPQDDVVMGTQIGRASGRERVSSPV